MTSSYYDVLYEHLYTACTLMIHTGAAMVVRLERLIHKVEGLLGQNNGMIQVQSCGLQCNEVLETLLASFQDIQTDFSRYGNIAGVYAVAVLTHLIFQCIGVATFIVSFVRIRAGDLAVNLHIFTGLPALVTLTYFGSYVTQAVSIYKL